MLAHRKSRNKITLERSYNNMNYTTEDYKSQVTKILRKATLKKHFNEPIINWCLENHLERVAENMKTCGRHIGITNIDGYAKIVKADFCRERLCAICAWRRQSKFVAQMTPALALLEKRGYQFIFASLTVNNVPYEELEETINNMMRAYKLLYSRRRVARAWKGVTRSLELTYKVEDDTLHPHIHLLIAVDEDYFTNKTKYISHDLLKSLWQDCLKVDYEPYVDIRKVYDESGAAVEVLKYALKPSTENIALSAFAYILKGRRLVSFTGVFAKVRKELKYSDFETILTDDFDRTKTVRYELYNLDCTGGVYKYYKECELTI